MLVEGAFKISKVLTETAELEASSLEGPGSTDSSTRLASSTRMAPGILMRRSLTKIATRSLNMHKGEKLVTEHIR